MVVWRNKVVLLDYRPPGLEVSEISRVNHTWDIQTNIDNIESNNVNREQPSEEVVEASKQKAELVAASIRQTK